MSYLLCRPAFNKNGATTDTIITGQQDLEAQSSKDDRPTATMDFVSEQLSNPRIL